MYTGFAQKLECLTMFIAGAMVTLLIVLYMGGMLSEIITVASSLFLLSYISCGVFYRFYEDGLDTAMLMIVIFLIPGPLIKMSGPAVNIDLMAILQFFAIFYVLFVIVIISLQWKNIVNKMNN